MRRLRTVCLVAGLAGSLGHPQSMRAQNQVAFAFVLMQPRGELDRNVGTFNGPYLTYLRDLGSSRRWALGATGMGGTYGDAERPAPPGYRATTQNSVAFFTGVVQFKAATGTVQPYLQGIGGYGWFTTTTWVSCDDDDCDTHRIGQITDHGDGAFVAGGGAGLLMRIYERKRDVDARPGAPKSNREPLRAYVDIATRYLHGGKAKYVPGDPVFTDEGVIELDELKQSGFQALQYQVGVSVTF